MINSEDVKHWLEESAAVFESNKEYLTDLDSAIGDADHGINMDRGFKKVMSQLPAVADKGIGEILKKTGFTLMSSVGGASGPLYGTFFMEAAKAVSGKEELATEDVALLLEKGMQGIQRIGRSQPGEKTMLDTLDPALECLKQEIAEGSELVAALSSMVDAAKSGMEATVPMIATKGRASYLSERSIGHQDPGATSLYLLLEALLKIVNSS